MTGGGRTLAFRTVLKAHRTCQGVRVLNGRGLEFLVRPVCARYTGANFSEAIESGRGRGRVIRVTVRTASGIDLVCPWANGYSV